MVKVLCIPCSMEFPSDSVYRAHKQTAHGGHIPAGNGVASHLPDGVSPEMLPSPDFMEAVSRIEKRGQEAQSADSLEPVHLQPTSDPRLMQQLSLQTQEPQPITLTYKYTGDCPTHKTPVETLFIDIANSHMVLAYCGVCKTNRAQQKVIPLDKEQKSVKRAVNESKKEGEK